jgi:hypothetical protein
MLGELRGEELELGSGQVVSRSTLPNVTDPVRGFNRQALIGTPIEAQERADEPRQIRIRISTLIDPAIVPK